MNRKRHDLRAIAIAAYAAIPLYVTAAVAVPVLVAFHAILALLALRTVTGRAMSSLLFRLAQGAAIGYLVFFPIDAMLLSRSLIRASTHLLFFIAAYQAVEAGNRRNHGLRMLVIFFIFIASVATSTHVTVLLFVVGFAILAFRLLMDNAHVDTAEAVGQRASGSPGWKPAVLFLLPVLFLAAAMFPFLPRVRNPFVQGVTSELRGATTGISESIDFSVEREISPAGDVVARVWMSREAVPFFYPLRLRGPVYEEYEDGRWKPRRARRWIDGQDETTYQIARPDGVTTTAQVQQPLRGDRIVYLPTGSWQLHDIPRIVEAPYQGVYRAAFYNGSMLNYRAELALETLPLEPSEVTLPDYPLSDEVTALARRVAGDEVLAVDAAKRIEQYLLANYTYVPDPASIGRALTVDQFLLEERRGHCEYFAAGMVAMMTALGHPARIVGGFYGGKSNPLTGYFVLRLSDAHAWTEVWDGEKWTTFDPTPPSLRPGSGSEGVVRAYFNAIMDSITYFWDRYILTFGLTDQIRMALELIDRAQEALVRARSAARSAIRGGFTPAAPFSIAALIAFALLIRFALRRRRTFFAQLVDALERAGLKVDESMTVADLASAVKEQRPDLWPDVEPLLDGYLRDRFSGHPLPRESRNSMRRSLARIGR